MTNPIFTTLPMFTCFFWTVLFLLRYRQNDAGKRQLFWFMLCATVLYFGHHCYFHHYFPLLPITDTLYSFCNLAVYPIYFLYVRTTTTNRPTQWRDALWLLPALAVMLSNLGGYYLQSPSVVAHFIHHVLYNEPPMPEAPSEVWLTLTHRSSALLFMVQVVVVMIGSFRLIRRFEHRLAQFYTNMEGRALHLMFNLQVALLLTAFCSLVVNMVSKAFFAEHPLLLVIPSLLFSTCLFFIGYDGYRRTFSEAVFAHDLAVSDVVDAEELAPASVILTNNTTTSPSSTPAWGKSTAEQARYYETLAQRLVHIMRTEQLYLSPDLKISDLTRRLGINRNYLYYAISGALATSFNDLVNRMRIEHALRQWSEHPDWSNADVAIKAGYLNEASFYRNFKKWVGVTPLQWKKQGAMEFEFLFL